MSDADYHDDQGLVLDMVNDAIISNLDPVMVLEFPFQFFAPAGPGIRGERINPISDPFPVWE